MGDASEVEPGGMHWRFDYHRHDGTTPHANERPQLRLQEGFNFKQKANVWMMLRSGLVLGCVCQMQIRQNAEPGGHPLAADAA